MRPRLCQPLPPLPEPADVLLSRHAVIRYIRRVYGERSHVRFRDACDELRALVDAGEVVRSRPDGFGSGDRRFGRPADLVGFIEVRGELHLALPVKGGEQGYVATTTLLSRRPR